MKLNKIRNIEIAKEKYEWVNDVKIKVDYKKWVEFIDNNQDYFIWDENTKSGIHLRENMDKVPKNFRVPLSSISKTKAHSNYNEKEEYYETRILYHKEFGIIIIKFENKPKRRDVEIFIEMAEYLEAYLLIDGTKIITREDLDNGEIV
ncbi:hypothetical protein C8N26_1985 [Tenacibaculum lutimaris]|uniref:Uncharacterized protein n=1 Tax=Tenacibaculum lutimaris TaxID=285258 RepID=A0A420E0F7_9FLAO|nr:hypothetical protein [Tenacibaculum lutimaris]RKF03595.1 hypothetical protein C8N26_1985 [Tenacibaculum lutimaris]